MQGIGLRSLTEAIDTTTSGGRLAFQLFAALAEFERGAIRERTVAGLPAARARGRTGGRPPALDAKDLAAAGALLRDPAITVAEVARRLGGRPRPSIATCRARTAALEARDRAEHRHADQARATLLLPDRLAAGEPLGPVRARQGLLRRRAGDHSMARWSAIWAMVAGGDEVQQDLSAMAVAARSPAACPGRGAAEPNDQGRAGGSPSRPRP